MSIAPFCSPRTAAPIRPSQGWQARDKTNAGFLSLDYCVELGQETREVAIAVFLRKMAQRNGGRIVFAVRAHAVSSQDVKRLRKGGQQFSYRGIRIKALHSVGDSVLLRPSESLRYSRVCLASGMHGEVGMLGSSSVRMARRLRLEDRDKRTDVIRPSPVFGRRAGPLHVEGRPLARSAG